MQMGYLESILGTDERIVYATRRHWTVIAGTAIVSTILSVIIIAAAVALITPTAGVSLIALLLLIIPIGRLLTQYLDWWNERYVVTNRRIVQIDGVFNKHVIDSSIEKVNDVVLDQTMMGRLLGYGDTEIMTASEIGVNKLTKISNPILFKTTMLNQKEALSDGNGVHRHEPGLAAAAEKTIPDLIADLAALRDRGVLTEEEFQAKKANLMSRM
jgi:uncharacterized membrane protein YdbT with pleckstrin-like domain